MRGSAGRQRQRGITAPWRAHRHWLIPAGVALGLYLVTLAPTVTGEDSGELITAAYHFGVPHPPGYPLWTALCGIWLHILPFGNIAWRANLFSAVCTSVAIGLLAATLRRLRFSPLASIGASAVCAATATIWSQAVITEVYGMNLLFLCAILYVCARWYADRRTGWLVGASLLFGLGMSNHHILGFAALACALWILAQVPSYLRDGRLIATCLICFVVGLAPYAYLLWAGHRSAPVNWGEVTSLSALIEHASRGQYRSPNPIEAPVPMTAALFVGRCYYALRWVFQELTPVIVPFVAAGLFWLKRPSRRHLYRWVLWMLVCSGPLYLWVGGPRLDRQDEYVQKVFLTPLVIALAIPLAGGLQWLACSLRALKTRSLGSPLRWGLVVACVSAPLAWHYRENDMSRYWFAEDHAKGILACLERDAILIPSGDHNTFPLLYLIYVAGQRTDVSIADKYGYIDLALYRDMPNNPGKPRTPEERKEIEQWIAQSSNRPLYYTSKTQSPIAGQDMHPVGLTYRVAAAPPDNDRCWAQIRYRNLMGQDAPIDLAATNILADYHFARGMRAFQRKDWSAAQHAFADSAEIAWGLKEVANNIGSALAENGHVDEAIRYYETAARMDWRYAPARWNLARIFKSSGHFDWAAKVFEDLTRAAPKDFRPFGELGFLCRDQLGDIERARYWWYESIRLNPRQQQILVALAGQPHADARHESVPTVPGAAMSDTVPQPIQSVSLSAGEQAIDLGEVVEGDTPMRVIRIHQNGTEAVELAPPSVTCTCIEAALKTRTPNFDGSTELQVMFHSRGKLGSVNEAITFGTASQMDKPLTLRVRANVIPVLAVTPPVWEASIRPGQSLEDQEFIVRHAKGTPFEITAAVSSLPQVHFRSSTGQHAEHRIVAHLTALLERDLIGSITIKTTGSSSNDLIVPFALRCAALARASPALVYFGSVAGTESAQRAVRIEPTESGYDLDLSLEREKPVAGLDARLEPPRDATRAWRLVVAIEPRLAKRGVIAEVLRLRVAPSGQILEVPVHGFLSE